MRKVCCSASWRYSRPNGRLISPPLIARNVRTRHEKENRSQTGNVQMCVQGCHLNKNIWDLQICQWGLDELQSCCLREECVRPFRRLSANWWHFTAGFGGLCLYLFFQHALTAFLSNNYRDITQTYPDHKLSDHLKYKCRSRSVYAGLCWLSWWTRHVFYQSPSKLKTNW